MNELSIKWILSENSDTCGTCGKYIINISNYGVEDFRAFISEIKINNPNEAMYTPRALYQCKSIDGISKAKKILEEIILQPNSDCND